MGCTEWTRGCTEWPGGFAEWLGLRGVANGLHGLDKGVCNEMRLKVTIVAQTNLSKRVHTSTLVQQVSTVPF